MDLSSYTLTLPHDDFLPRNAPREKLELMLHHMQLEAAAAAFLQIEAETGLTRDQIGHYWIVRDGVSVCVFKTQAISAHCPPKPGISVLIG